MWIYLIYLMIISFVHLYLKNLRQIGKINTEQKKKLFSIFAFLGMSFIMSLKHYSVGGDWIQYLHRYDNNNTPREIIANFSLTKEHGFDLITALMKSIDISHQQYIMIIGILFSFSFIRFFKKISKNIYLDIFFHMTIGLFSFSMTGIRQTISILLILEVYQMLLNTKQISKIRSLLYIFVASLFHNSSIVLLPLIFVNKKKYRDYNKFLLFCIPIFTLASQYLVPIIFKIIRFSNYSIYEISLSSSNVNPILIIFYFCLIITMIIIRRLFEMSDSEEFNGFLFYSLISYYLLVIANFLIGVDRITLYFNVFYGLLMTETICNIKNPKNRLLVTISTLLITLLFFIVTIPNSKNSIYNYRFFWR